MELIIAANIGLLPTAMLAMTAASAILSTVTYVTSAVTEASKTETVGRLLGEDPRSKQDRGDHCAWNPRTGSFLRTLKCGMSLGTVGTRSERLQDTADLRCRWQELFRQWQSFSGLLGRGLSQLSSTAYQQAESDPGSIAHTHTLFDALASPLRMTRAARTKKLTKSRAISNPMLGAIPQYNRNWT